MNNFCQIDIEFNEQKIIIAFHEFITVFQIAYNINFFVPYFHFIQYLQCIVYRINE